MEIQGKSGKPSFIRFWALAALSALFAGANARAQTIQEFAVPTPLSSPRSIAAGPDGNLWFTESDAGRIGRITPGGAIVEYPLPSASCEPWRIAAGPDGALWFTELLGNRIGRITTAGVVTEFPIPTPKSIPAGIVAGPDGALWFTEREANKIGRISVTGSIQEFSLDAQTGPNGIAVGADGALWFAEQYAFRAGRMTVAGAWTESAVLAAGYPFGIAAKSDGSVWVTTTPGDAGAVVSLSASGTPTSHAITPYAPGDAVIDAKGNVWSTEADGKIVRIAPAGKVTSFSVPSEGADPVGIAVGPDGNIWFAEAGGNRIGRLDPSATDTSCTAPDTPALLVDGAATASASAGDHVALSWTGTLGGSTGSYQVLRSDGPGLPFSPEQTTTSPNLSVALNADDAGKTILFEVRATHDCVGAQATSGTSNAVSVVVAPGNPPPPPPPPPPAGCVSTPGSRPCSVAPGSTPDPAAVDRSR